MLAGLAGSAAVARVQPALVSWIRPPFLARAESDSTVRYVAKASRQALVWVLVALLVIPWFPSTDRVMDWLELVIPMSFSWQGLMEPWWLRFLWLVASRIGQWGS